MKKIRVGFPLISSAEWTGGFNYLHNLLSAVIAHQSSRIEPVLFCGEDAREDDVDRFKQLAHVQIVRSYAFNAARQRSSLSAAILWGLDANVVDVFLSHQIDVLFENATFYGWRLPIPAIAWFPDFQHRRLREYFSRVAYFKREVGFRVQIASKRVIMLSSEDARSDCERFYSGSIARTTVVRFATMMDPSLISEKPNAVLQEYGIREPFYYLPNQFWKHKNHDVVIEALGLLKREGCELLVVSTGNPRNFLHPDMFSQLERKVSNLGLESNMRFLGMVPRDHVISLMRTCRGLLNPSFFEGWSSTVEEARVFGTPMLLSDIPVHREQMGKDAHYFNPFEPVALSDLMRKCVQDVTCDVVPRNIQAEAAQNVVRFAQDFLKTVEWA